MGWAREPLFRRFVVLAIVLGGHVLLARLITSDRMSERREAFSTLPERSMLVLIEPRPEPPKPLPVPPLESQPRPVLSRDAPAEPTPAAAAGTPATAPVGRPSIDWRSEAQITIRKMAPQIAKEQKQKCAEAKRIGAAPPFGCAKKSYEPNWKPEPDQAGLMGLFPYVRLGKRCVAGLGFFGCALGKLPEADGTLFDDMYDPNRPTSSVPDIDNGDGVELPPPVVLQDP